MRYHRAGPGVSVHGRIVGQWRYNRCAKPFIPKAECACRHCNDAGLPNQLFASPDPAKIANNVSAKSGRISPLDFKRT
jgi:hypothetical protein